MSTPRRVRFAVTCTSDNDTTPSAPAVQCAGASPLLGTGAGKMAYNGRTAHLAALVLPAVSPCSDIAGDAMPYACIPRLVDRLPVAAKDGAEEVGTLARQSAESNLPMAWAGKQWVSVPEFVVAAGVAATKLCGKPAHIRHKAVVRKRPGGAYVLELVEFPHGEQRGRFFVH